MSDISSIHDKVFKTSMADIRVAREFFEVFIKLDLQTYF
jgi:hypothetical protein